MKKYIFKSKTLITAVILCALSLSSVKLFAGVQGALSGQFSVSATKKVYFSQGNLQYQASTNTFRFAPAQYTRIGVSGNNKISSTYTGWIDWYSWGTGNNPTKVGGANSDYSTFTDWGKNQISNGGNQANLWRTMTQAEWEYLFSGRTNAAQKRSMATVNNVKGYIFLPDSWTLPSGLSFKADRTSWEANKYSSADWQKMEQNGAIFLPKTASINSEINGSGITYYDAGYYDDEWGMYWSSTKESSGNAHIFKFCVIEYYSTSSVEMESTEKRFRLAVRLVIDSDKNTSYTIKFVDADGNAIGTPQVLSPGQSATPPTAPSRSGYSFVGWIGNYQNVHADATIYASYQINNGVLPGLFSISSTEKIYFSQGNLQYYAASGTHSCADGSTMQGVWRFAENQYDVIGNANANVSSSYAGWIDLFGWGTSGYHNSSDSYNTQYNPYSTSSATVNEQYNYYGYGPSMNQADANMVGTSAYYDWGVYNAIFNGGKVPEGWRTLSWQEMEYLLNERANAANLKGVARVNGVNGAVLLPDYWICPDGITFQTRVAATNHADSFKVINDYTLAQWKLMETAGAVFLPCAGARGANTVIGSLQTWGHYWTTTASANSQTAYDFRVTSNSLSCNASEKLRRNGFSVRLVKNALGRTVTFVDADGNTIGTPQVVEYGQSATPPTAPEREGYTFAGWIGNYQNVTGDATIYASYYKNSEASVVQPGALDGVFSVSPTEKVLFSQGNLHYNAMSGTHACADASTQKGVWRFAEHQYDTLGISQAQKAENYAGWVSAFAWGTSGWNNGANLYQPWAVSGDK